MRWLRSWFKATWHGPAEVLRELASLDERLEKLGDRRASLFSALAVAERAATEARDALRARDARVEQLVGECRSLQSQYEEELQTVRSQLKVQEQTIDSLTAAHRLVLAEYDARIAIEARRQAGATGGGGSSNEV